MAEQTTQQNGATQQGAFTSSETRSGTTAIAPQCPVPNVTIFIDRHRYRRHRQHVTYHYHHAP